MNPHSHSINPFDSDSEYDCELTSPKASLPPAIIERNSKNSISLGDRESRGISSKDEEIYASDFCESGGIEKQSVQELQIYAAYKAEKTTKSVSNCLKIAEDIKEDAIKTLTTLHQQGEQITRSHMVAVEMDRDLSLGEKLLGNLGGIFSRTWKPKITRPIKGPLFYEGSLFDRKVNNLEQRERLGVSPPCYKGQSNNQSRHSQQSSAMEKVSNNQPRHSQQSSAMKKVTEEKAKQDDTLSDLSNLLGDLKNMAVDMGSEIDRQNKALNRMHDDIDDLNIRVKGANQQGRRLLRK